MDTLQQARDYLNRMLEEHFAATVATGAALSTAALWYLLSGSSKPSLEYPVGLDNQSYELEPGVRCSYFAPNGKLATCMFEDAQTLYEGFLRGKRLAGDNGEFLGTRTGPNLSFEWVTYKQAYDQARKVGSMFLSRGLQPGSETFVGIYAANSPQWVITAEACNMFSMVVVPLYDTLGPEACAYIMNQTEMKIILIDKISKALDAIKHIDKTPSVKNIICVEGTSDELREAAQKVGVDVFSYHEALDIGANNLQEPIPPKPTDVATICYTSGTTGNPKGVLLSHRNLVANLGAVKAQMEGIEVSSEDSHLSYLPLAHMFEKLVHALVIQHGAKIGFFRGDVKLLTDDMQALRPTIFPTVPRLLNRIYDKVLMGVQSSKLKSFIFNLAMRKKTAMLKRGIITKDSIWDKLVFSKVQKLMGGRVKFVVTGSAPLSANVLNFTRVAMGCLVFEGYGQTEANAAVTLTLPLEHGVGHVGAPVSCNLIKLIDVPEMDYWAKDNKGEVCVKGTNVMVGYYKEPQKTADTIDKDGWLHTGDVGQWMPNGTLKIIDRAKHIFKLAQGEYLAPEKIEQIYTRSSFVAQAFVDGSSLQTYAVGVIVPDPEVLPGWAKSKGFAGNIETLCKNPEVKKAILDDVQKEGKTAGLRSFEQTKKIFLFPELFSVENELLTPTFKSKRPALRKFFAKEIDAMYQD